MNTELKTPTPPAATSSITALPTPSEETILRDQLAATEAERDKLRTENTRLNVELKQYDDALVDLRTKLKAHEENPLSFTLANLDAGQVLIDAGAQLTDLCATVMRRQEKGRIGISITVKPFKGQALVFVPEVKVTPPKPEPAQSVFYAGEDGALSRNDPTQKEFHFNQNRERSEDEPFNPTLR